MHRTCYIIYSLNNSNICLMFIPQLVDIWHNIYVVDPQPCLTKVQSVNTCGGPSSCCHRPYILLFQFKVEVQSANDESTLSLRCSVLSSRQSLCGAERSSLRGAALASSDPCFNENLHTSLAWACV